MSVEKKIVFVVSSKNGNEADFFFSLMSPSNEGQGKIKMKLL